MERIEWLFKFLRYKEVVIANPPDGDLGDAPQRTAMFYIGLFLRGFTNDFYSGYFKLAIFTLQKDGWLIRDPTAKDRGGVMGDDPKDISRDQEDPWVIACSLYGFQPEVRKYIFRRWKRFGRYQNSDVMNFETLAMDFRALNWWWMYPIIFVCDVWTVGGAIAEVIGARLPGRMMKDGPWLDKDNSVTRFSFYKFRYPTPLSYLARTIAYKFFPDNVGGVGIFGAVKNKHREGNGNPAMAELWEPLI